MSGVLLFETCIYSVISVKDENNSLHRIESTMWHCTKYGILMFLTLVQVPEGIRTGRLSASPPHILLELGGRGFVDHILFEFDGEKWVPEKKPSPNVLIAERDGDEFILSEEDHVSIDRLGKQGLSDDEIEKKYAIGRIKLKTIKVLRGTVDQNHVLPGGRGSRGKLYLFIGKFDKPNEIWQSRFIKCDGLPIEEIESVVKSAMEIQSTIARERDKERREALLRDFLTGSELHSRAWLTIFPHWFQELKVWETQDTTELWTRLHKVIEAELKVSKEIAAETWYTPAGWSLKLILDGNGPHPPISLLLQCLDRKHTLLSLAAQLLRDLTEAERTLAIEKLRSMLRNPADPYDYNMHIFDALARLQAHEAFPEMKIVQERAGKYEIRYAAEWAMVKIRVDQASEQRLRK